MGNCLRCKRKPKRKIILLLVGLDNAGKTVAVKGLAGDNSEDSIPTIGFSVVNLKYLKYQICIYDLGGRHDIRGIWHRYFVDAHGIIYVIDASDYERFPEAKQVLENLLSHEKISGKPVLILANKQDNKQALDEIDLIEKLDLENLVNEKKCPTLVESCSAKESTNKIDPGIEKGYNWLLNYIIKEYATINKRVEIDMEKQKEINEQMRREKIERIKMNHETPEQVISKNHELVNGKSDLINNFINSPTHSVHSTNSCIYYEKSNSSKSENGTDRPKSAVQIVKKQLQKTSRRNSLLNRNNKTTPLTLLSPKSAPVKRTEETNEFEDNFRSASHTGQILTVTELPNAIIDANGENIGDLFELNNYTTKRKLPPIRTKAIDDYSWINKPKMNGNGIQNNIDEIYKDIS